MCVCVCVLQRMLNEFLGLRNPHKDRLCTIKKLDGMNKRDQVLCKLRRSHAQIDFLFFFFFKKSIYKLQLTLVNTLVIYKVEAFGFVFYLKMQEKIKSSSNNQGLMTQSCIYRRINTHIQEIFIESLPLFLSLGKQQLIGKIRIP